MGVSLALGYEDMSLQASIGLEALALRRPDQRSAVNFLYSLMIARLVYEEIRGHQPALIFNCSIAAANQSCPFDEHQQSRELCTSLERLKHIKITASDQTK